MTPEERIADLEEQVAYYKAELGLSDSAKQLDTLSRMTGCTRAEAALLLRLYRTKTLISKHQLADSMPFTRSDREVDSNTATILICRIRKKIGHAAIKNHWGQGYSLGDPGREIVEWALARAERVAA